MADLHVKVGRKFRRASHSRLVGRGSRRRRRTFVDSRSPLRRRRSSFVWRRRRCFERELQLRGPSSPGSFGAVPAVASCRTNRRTDSSASPDTGDARIAARMHEQEDSSLLQRGSSRRSLLAASAATSREREREPTAGNDYDDDGD